MNYDKQVILLVEDEEGIRDAFKGMLEASGFEVLTASCGREGLYTYGDNQGIIDLIVSDIDCAGNSLMDGPQMASTIRESGFDTPIIFMTGRKDNLAMEAVIKTNPHRIFMKPLSIKELLPAINQAIPRPAHVA